MEAIEHQGKDEYRVLTTVEKNHSKKKIKKMLITIMATHEILAKKTFEFNLKKKIPSQIHLIMG